MRTIYSLFLASLFVISACSLEEETGPVEVRWDKESCTRCAMAVSDFYFSAQIRGGPADSRTKVYKFDDIGCAVIWLDQQSWKDDARTEVWVNDHRNGEWIDARKASYVTGLVSPMAYGLGAQSDPATDGLDYTAASLHIYQVEETSHKHRGHKMHDGQGR